MKFHESGLWDAPVLMLLPGTCCHWQRNFGHVLPLLNQRFHVVCASYDGFDETENTVFTTVTDQVEKIEAFVRDNFGGHYGAAVEGFHPDELFEALGIEKDEERLRYYLLMDELF